MTRYFTVSVSLFILTGAVMLLQMIPLVGIFMMFMLAMLWPVLLLNLAFVAMLVECALGILPRVLIVIPLTYFIGYSVMAYQSRLGADELIAEAMQEAEAFKTITHDGSPVLFVGNTAEYESLQSPQIPLLYMQDNQGVEALQLVNKAECEQIDSRIKQEYDKLATAYRLADKPYDGWLGIRVDDYSYNKNDPLNAKYCRFRYPAEASDDLVKVVVTEERAASTLGVHKHLTHYTVVADGQPERRFTTGSISALGFIPMPVMGCGLDSSTPAWRCEAGFIRNYGGGYESLKAVKAHELLKNWLVTSPAVWPQVKLDELMSRVWDSFLQDEQERLARLAEPKAQRSGRARSYLPNMHNAGFPQLLTHPELVAPDVAYGLTSRLITPGSPYIEPRQRTDIDMLLAKVPQDFSEDRVTVIAQQLRRNACAMLRGQNLSAYATPALDARYADAIRAADIAVLEAALKEPAVVTKSVLPENYPGCILTAHTDATGLSHLLPQLVAALEQMVSTSQEPLWKQSHWSYKRFAGELALVFVAVPDDALAPYRPALARLFASQIDPGSRESMQEYFPQTPRYALQAMMPAVVERLGQELLAEEQQRLSALLPALQPVARGKAEIVSLMGGRHVFVQLTRQPEALRIYAQPLTEALTAFIRATLTHKSGWESRYAFHPNYLVYLAGHLLQALPEDAWLQVRPALAQALVDAPHFRFNYERYAPHFFARMDSSTP